MASGDRCESYRKYIERQYDRDGFNGYYHAKGACVQTQEQKVSQNARLSPYGNALNLR
jgi:hypothetical protein